MNQDNEFTHEDNTYSVWVQDGFAGQQITYIFRKGDKKNAVAGTTFGKTASFKYDIMPWAKKCIEKNFSKNNANQI